MKKEGKNNVLLYGSYLLLVCILVFINTTYAGRPEVDDEYNDDDDVVDVITTTTTTSSAINKRKLEEELATVHILPQEGLKEKDRIQKLPGQPHDVKFGQYGGYVTVNKDAGRAFYYYFIEADGLTDAPLILWLSGGPGCSSVGFGAFSALGPFRIKSNGKDLYENIYAWNKVANVLFLETPVRVGFSYSNTSSDGITNGDKRTASDNYIFLLNWFERFPEYKNKDFYISGESYSGHYIPQLVDYIIKQNQLPSNKNNLIKIKAISIGNPMLDIESDDSGRYRYLWMHAIISDDEKDKIEKLCDFSVDDYQKTPECMSTLNKANEKIAKLDIYNIYASTCKSQGVTDDKQINDFSITNFDPCSYNYMVYYLNLPEVQLALHANVTKLPYPWIGCSDARGDFLHPKWLDEPNSTIPELKNILDNGLPILIYSGDFDADKPYPGTLQILNKKLNLTVKVPSTPWNVSGEVAGYITIYKGVTFTTIRGSGHSVPSYQPERGLAMITHFLRGEEFPEMRPN